jgi:hypothetical protein
MWFCPQDKNAIGTYNEVIHQFLYFLITFPDFDKVIFDEVSDSH